MDAVLERAVVAPSDFVKARSKARKAKIYSFLSGRNDDLLSLDEVKKTLRPTGESYVGCRTIPVKRIVGSEGRCKDFNRGFMPRGDHMQGRWARVDRAFYDKKELPPVTVFELGGVYFVRDGNHRISVARLHNIAYIDADITRLMGAIELEPGMTIQDIERRVRSTEEPKAAA